MKENSSNTQKSMGDTMDRGEIRRISQWRVSVAKISPLLLTRSASSSVTAVESVQSAGKVCILDIDFQGVQNVKKSSLKPIYVFVSPPSMEELEHRLRGRGTEKEEDIQQRLGNAAKEMEYGTKEGNFDKVYVNDNLTKTFEILVKDIKGWYPQLKENLRPRPVVFAGPSGVGKVS